LASSKRVKILGLIPILAIIIVMVILYMLNINTVFDPPYLLTILSTVFISATSFVVSYISTKGYLKTGSLSLSLLSSGVLILGLVFLIAGWGKDLVGVNAMVTIHNLGVFFSSCIFFGGAILSLGWPSYQGILPFSFKKRATLAYVGVTVFVIFLTMATLQGFLPLFFVQGVGPTPLRQWVIGTAAVLFALSAIVFMRLYFKTNSNILYWYSLALTLFAFGFLDIFLVKTTGNPLTWIGRSTQYFGGLYFLIAVLTTVRQTSKGKRRTIIETVKSLNSPISWTGRAAHYLSGIYFLIVVIFQFRKTEKSEASTKGSQ
jgi:hypothetical protein